MALGYIAVGLDDNDDVVIVTKSEDGNISTITLSKSRADLLSILLFEAVQHNKIEDMDEVSQPWCGNGIDVTEMCTSNDITSEELDTLFKTAADMK